MVDTVTVLLKSKNQLEFCLSFFLSFFHSFFLPVCLSFFLFLSFCLTGCGCLAGLRGRLYTHRYTATTSCIKMGSDESHFNAALHYEGHSHKTTPINHNLFKEKGEPKRIRAEALLLTIHSFTARPNRLTHPIVSCLFFFFQFHPIRRGHGSASELGAVVSSRRGRSVRAGGSGQQ